MEPFADRKTNGEEFIFNEVVRHYKAAFHGDIIKRELLLANKIEIEAWIRVAMGWVYAVATA